MSIPFALSLSKYVNSAGTDVGFGSLLAVAMLALLYFAGARETRTLRDQLEEAHSRITSLEARVAQALRSQSARPPQATQTGQIPSVPGRPGVVPPPSVAQPMGSTVARIRREAGSAGAAGVAGAAALLGAPAGAGAPALGSATRLISSPVGPLVPAFGASPATVAAQTGSAAYPDDDGDDDFVEVYGPEDTLFVPAGAGADAGAVANGGRGGGTAVAAPPRMQLGDDPPASPPPRRTIPTVDSGPSGSRRLVGRLVGSLAAVVVVAVIVVVLLVITSNHSHSPRRVARVTTRSTPARTKTRTAAAPFNPRSVKVSVLNGTGLTGVAADIGADLTSAGYTVPAVAVTNAAIETVNTTVVAYRPGYRVAALKVAAALSKKTDVPVDTVQPANQAAITSCATPDTGTGTGTCPADVIVTVGSDLAGSATSGA
jgi:hypothetical protein